MKRFLLARKGAAVVEFIVALVPVLMLFFAITQFAVLGYVGILVQHAAFVSSRAYAVVHPGMYDSGSPADVENAAKLVLARVPGTLTVSSTSVPALSQEMSTTKITFQYTCKVPLGEAIVCGGGNMLIWGGKGGGGSHTFHAQSSFPNQGTYMQKVWGL